jgi:hypothetical protein
VAPGPRRRDHTAAERELRRAEGSFVFVEEGFPIHVHADRFGRGGVPAGHYVADKPIRLGIGRKPLVGASVPSLENATQLLGTRKGSNALFAHAPTLPRGRLGVKAAPGDPPRRLWRLETLLGPSAAATTLGGRYNARVTGGRIREPLSTPR